MIKSNVSESRSHSLQVSCSYSHYNVELCTLENYSIMQIKYVYHLCLYLLYLFLYQQLKQYKMFCFQLFWLIENFKIKAVNKMLWLFNYEKHILKMKDNDTHILMHKSSFHVFSLFLSAKRSTIWRFSD